MSNSTPPSCQSPPINSEVQHKQSLYDPNTVELQPPKVPEPVELQSANPTPSSKLVPTDDPNPPKLQTTHGPEPPTSVKLQSKPDPNPPTTSKKLQPLVTTNISPKPETPVTSPIHPSPSSSTLGCQSPSPIKSPYISSPGKSFRISDHLEPQASATIHGIIKSISDIQKSPSGDKYYDCDLVDKKSVVRAISFSHDAYMVLNQHYLNKQPVAITNCTIKRHRDCDDLEVVINKKTRVSSSHIECIDDTPPDPTYAPLSSLPCLPASKRISVKAKVIKLFQIQSKQDNRTLTKRDAIIADSTGNTKVVLWEGNINSMEVDHSYILDNAVIRAFRGVKYLSVSPNTKIIEMDDIPDVITSTQQDHNHLVTGEIAACSNLTRYHSCLLCKAKLNCDDTIQHNSIRCHQCMATLKLIHCPTQLTARIIIIESDDSPSPRQVTLQIFTKQILQLTGLPMDNLLHLSNENVASIIASNNVITASFEGYTVKEITIH